MPIRKGPIQAALGLWCAAALACRTAPAQGAAVTQDSTAARVRPVLSQALPKLDGSQLKVTVVEVSYPPGGSSKPHSHPCEVIGYVIQGALRFQVRGGPDTVISAGGSFYEPANSVHQVSANASRTEPVKFLAYFTCDRDTPLTVPPPAP